MGKLQGAKGKATRNSVGLLPSHIPPPTFPPQFPLLLTFFITLPPHPGCCHIFTTVTILMCYSEFYNPAPQNPFQNGSVLLASCDSHTHTTGQLGGNNQKTFLKNVKTASYCRFVQCCMIVDSLIHKKRSPSQYTAVI